MEFKPTEQAKKIWQRTCAALKTEMNTVSFEAFIEKLEPVSVVNEDFILCAPNEMLQTTVMKYYHESITACIIDLFPSIESAVIIIPDDLGKYIRDTSYSDLFSKYTFDTFVVGSSNYFAHAACKAVAEKPAETYNPLFLYGGVGLGKTHLMHAIGHQIRRHDPRAGVMYVTSETFTNEMIQSIASNRNREFRNRYRNVDVLMVDDIQFIAKKEGVQEEFFHTFNALHTANKQIIISSDKPPREIASLEERLRSRFEWGLIADIQPPDLETRIAILKRRAEIEKCYVPNDVLYYIAENVESNIRELEGCLNRVNAYAQINRQRISLEMCKEALINIIKPPVETVITPELIKKTVAEFFELPIESFSSKRRDQETAYPRQIAMYLCREMTDASLSQIGDVFGGRNHTTVMHAYDKIMEKLKDDRWLNTSIEDLKKRLKAPESTKR